MRHPTDGTLRRLVDEPAGVADADREHIAGCPRCQAALATAQRDAALTGAALHFETTSDVDSAWHRLSRAAAAEPVRRPAALPATRRWRAGLRSPVLAVAAAVALVTGAGAAAATNWLPVFRAEKIAPVTAPQVELAKLPELEAFGDLKITEKVNGHKVSDAAAAQRETGLALPRVGALPRGVTGEPSMLAFGRASAEFTFSAAKAAQFVTSSGGTPPTPPAGLDGSRFQLLAGPGVAMVWADNRPRPAMVVARVKAPTVFSSGIPFATARDYLLSLPGLPPNVSSQLRGLTGDGSGGGDSGMTLPLFVSTDEATAFTADVNGIPATVLAPKDAVMAAVVWVDRGVVTAVAGSLTTDEVLSVARGLRWS